MTIKTPNRKSHGHQKGNPADDAQGRDNTRSRRQPQIRPYHLGKRNSGSFGDTRMEARIGEDSNIGEGESAELVKEQLRSRDAYPVGRMSY